MARRGQGNKGNFKNNGKSFEEDIINHATQQGLKYLVSQPELKNYAVLIMNNLDDKKLSYFVEGLKEELNEKNLSYEEKMKSLQKGVAEYVASGSALKDKTQQTLFDETNESKSKRGVLEKIVGFFKPNKSNGTEYFEKARAAYSDMYDILSQDEHAQKELPELVKAAQTLRMYGFLKAALNNFKAHGMMDNNMYKTLSSEITKNALIQSEKGRKGLENYILSKKEEQAYQKISAGLFLIVGLALLALTGVNMTGNAIGNFSPKTSGLVGVILIFLALLMSLLINRRKKHSKKHSK